MLLDTVFTSAASARVSHSSFLYSFFIACFITEQSTIKIFLLLVKLIIKGFLDVQGKGEKGRWTKRNGEVLGIIKETSVSPRTLSFSVPQ